MSDPTAKPFHGSTSGAPSNASVSVTTTANTGGVVFGPSGGVSSVGSSGLIYDASAAWGSTPLLKGVPPPMTEQKFNNLTRSQAISILIHLIENKAARKLVSSLVGCFEMPDREIILSMLTWVRDPAYYRTIYMCQDTVSSFNSVQSVSNLLRAVSDELDLLIKEGKALKVEEITQ